MFFSEDVNSDIEYEAPKVTKAAAPPKKRVQKQHIVSSDSDGDEAPKVTKAAPAAKKKQQQQLRGSDSEEEPPAKVTKAAAARKRLQKATTTTGMKEEEKVEVVEESTSVSVVESPEPAKVRKIKVSPFNKKSKALTSKEVMEAAVAEAANRPQRAAAGRRKVQYIISDSSEEDEESKGESESDASVFSDTESFS